MNVKAIHQFHESCAPGDGITQGMLYTQRLLRELGFDSEIYCDRVPPELQVRVRQRKELKFGPDTLLLQHFGLGYADAAWLEQSGIPRVLVYHNITPPHLLPEGGLREMSILGREQLAHWPQQVLGAIGDSDYNTDELIQCGYRNVCTIPMLVDLAQWRQRTRNLAACAPFRGAFNVLFVGRISENKRQLELVEMIDQLRRRLHQPVRLLIPGGFSSPAYAQQIRERVRDLGLERQVYMPGKVDDATLDAMYRSADAFVCMSEHEGFGMPLIEAMLYDVPVLANALGSVASTMGEGGLLLEDATPATMAAAVHMLAQEPGLRRRILRAQRRNLARFEHRRLLQQLSDYLASLGVVSAGSLLPDATPCTSQQEGFESAMVIEGPYDSSYSLAVVNRELARALHSEGAQVGLRSMDGGRDYSPNAEFMAGNADLRALELAPTDLACAVEVGMRFCYPPHADAIPGVMRLIHSYGWEESGFPGEYVDAFNRKLDGVTVLSRYVQRVLRNNGVRIPIAVTGAGVDHLLRVKPVVPLLRSAAFRFLHVSSCFPRKGVDVLLRAFGRAFRLEDDVVLVIKTFVNPHNDVQEQLERLRAADQHYPKVEIICEDWEDGRMAGLYTQAHALVAPSRGEGLGLPLAEAMLFGVPVVTTAYGGQTDFCDESTAWLCDFTFIHSGSHVGAGHSVWAEPDETDLVRALRDVYESPAAVREARTSRARDRVQQELTWSAAAMRTQAALALLEQQPLVRKAPRIGWISTWNARCGIATYSNFLSQSFPRERLVMLANRIADPVAEDDANVVRCWQAHSTETLDELFEAALAQGVGALVIQYNFGFYTVHTLARLIRRAKDAGIAIHCFFHSTADVTHGDVLVSLRDIVSELRMAERIYVHGVHDMNRLKSYGVLDNLVYFPHGLPALRDRGREHTRAELGLTHRKVIGSYGFLLPHKGIATLIEAFAMLAHKDPSVHLLLVNALYPIIDSVHERDRCMALIEHHRLITRVTILTDFLPDETCLRLLSAADMVVYPYRDTQESASGAVRIGMATGVPVVVTPIPIFDDVRDAVVTLDGCDAHAIARGIEAMLSEPQRLSQQAQRVTDWARPREWPVVSRRLLNVIDGVANELPPVHPAQTR